LTPEARARQSIDALLVAAGWVVQDLKQARIVAAVERQPSVIREVEVEVDANLQRAQALRRATLARAFSPKVMTDSL
jgi:hypothetical protein